MTNPVTKGNGKTYRWLVEHSTFAGPECLTWPFSTHPTGYGTFGHNGGHFYAHRFMCELVHGPAPSPKHYASHNCGNGHLSCIHPGHLAWKTPYENAIDRLRHGNNHKAGRKRDKLTAEQASEIFALKGVMTQYEMAALYKVSRETISSIHTGRGRSRKRPFSPSSLREDSKP